MTGLDGGEAAMAHPAPKRPGLLVLLGGVLTTILALSIVLVVEFASEGEFSLMGYYLFYIVPVSAIAVGAVAGCGYSIVSWLRGVRVAGRLLLVVFLLMVCGYFTAHYVEYSVIDPRYEDGTKVGFWKYFDFATRSLSFRDRNDKEGRELGAWGYGVRALELTGFSLGGLVPLFVLWVVPYCERCQVYKKTSALCTIPAAAPARKVKRGDVEARAALSSAHAEVEKQAEAALEQITQAVIRGDVEHFTALVRPYEAGAKEAAKRPKRLTLTISHCPICSSGEIKVSMTSGKGDKLVVQERVPIPAEPDFIRDYLDRQAASRLGAGAADAVQAP